MSLLPGFDSRPHKRYSRREGGSDEAEMNNMPASAPSGIEDRGEVALASAPSGIEDRGEVAAAVAPSGAEDRGEVAAAAVPSGVGNNSSDNNMPSLSRTNSKTTKRSQNTKNTTTNVGDLSTAKQAEKAAAEAELSAAYHADTNYTDPNSLASLIPLREDAKARKERLQRANLIRGIGDAVDLVANMIIASRGGNVIPTTSKADIDANLRTIKADEDKLRAIEAQIKTSAQKNKEAYLKGKEKLNDRFDKLRERVSTSVSDNVSTNTTNSTTRDNYSSVGRRGSGGIAGKDNQILAYRNGDSNDIHNVKVKKADYDNAMNLLQGWIDSHKDEEIQYKGQTITLAEIENSREQKTRSKSEGTNYGMTSNSERETIRPYKLSAADVVNDPDLLQALPADAKRYVYALYRNGTDGEDINLKEEFIDTYRKILMSADIPKEALIAKLSAFTKYIDGINNIPSEKTVQKWSSSWDEKNLRK